MTVYCKLCRHAAHSAEPHESAQSIVLTALANHLVTSHTPEAAQLANDIATLQMLLSTYLLVTHYVEVPAGEKALLQNIAENEQALVNLFAIAPGSVVT
jgi:hypothetical protein